MHGGDGGHAWQGGIHGGGGHVCMAGGAWWGHAWHGRYYGIWSMSRRYTSYWNAFLFHKRVSRILGCAPLHAGIHLLGRHPPHPRWILQWTVPILLECILVISVIASHFYGF